MDKSWQICKAMTEGKTCWHWIKHSVHQEKSGIVYWRGLPAKPPHKKGKHK